MTQVEVVYPSTSSFSGTGQLNLGPYYAPAVNSLLRAEVRGSVNYIGATISTASVFANFQLWALQWVQHGTLPQDCVLVADGPQWLIREQTNTLGYTATWAPSTDDAGTVAGVGLNADWAGQLYIGEDIDFYLSLRAPTGADIAGMNLFASIRWWWS